MILTEKMIREMRESLTSINITGGDSNAPKVAERMLREMYAELCDLALYGMEHDGGGTRAPCTNVAVTVRSRRGRDDATHVLLLQVQTNRSSDGSRRVGVHP